MSFINLIESHDSPKGPRIYMLRANGKKFLIDAYSPEDACRRLRAAYGEVPARTISSIGLMSDERIVPPAPKIDAEQAEVNFNGWRHYCEFCEERSIEPTLEGYAQEAAARRARRTVQES